MRILLLDVPMFTLVQVEHTVASTTTRRPKSPCRHRSTANLGKSCKGDFGRTDWQTLQVPKLIYSTWSWIHTSVCNKATYSILSWTPLFIQHQETQIQPLHSCPLEAGWETFAASSGFEGDLFRFSLALYHNSQQQIQLLPQEWRFDPCHRRTQQDPMDK